MTRETARQLCELLGINPDAPVGKTDRQTAVADLLTEKPADPIQPAD